MLKMHKALLVVGVLGLVGAAYAASPSRPEYFVTGPTGERSGPIASVMNMWFDGAANLPRPISTDYPVPVTGTVTTAPTGTQAVSTSPNRGTATRTNPAVGTTAVQIIPAGPQRSFWMVQNNSPTAMLTCTLDGTAPVSMSAGFTVYPNGGTRTQAGFAGAFMAVGALTCISSAAGTPVAVEYLQ